jgi:DNA primase
MGTSLTSGQASLLRRFTRRVVICYDGDDAGRNATLRAAPVLLSAGLHVEVLDLMGEKDPDTLVQKHGADRFLELLGNATDIFAFGLKEWGTEVSKLTGRDKSERVEHFVPLLGAVTDPVVRNDAAQRIADAFHLEFDVVWSRVRGKAQAAPADRQFSPPSASAEKVILAASLQGKLPRNVAERVHEGLFEDSACRTLFSVIKNELAAGKPIDFGAVATHLKGEAELTLLSELTLRDDIDDQTLQRIDENLRPLEKSYLERRTTEIQREIVEAVRVGDDGRLSELLAEKGRISSSLK